MKRFLLLTSLCLAAITSHTANAQVYYQTAPAPIVVQAPSPYCREFTQTFTIAGESQTSVGTACLQANGAWEIVQPARSVSGSFRYVAEGGRIFFIPLRPFAAIHYDHHDHYRHEGHGERRYEYYR